MKNKKTSKLKVRKNEFPCYGSYCRITNQDDLFRRPSLMDGLKVTNSILNPAAPVCNKNATSCSTAISQKSFFFRI